MKPRDVRIFDTAADFRAWLEANHDTADHIWVGYYRKGVSKTAMTYPEAVEEALCMGWIDGQAGSVSDEVWSNRFTPRRKGSNWSVVNIGRVAALRAAARMHPAGIRAFEERDQPRDATYSYERPPENLPAEYLARFEADATAWDYWQAETPSYRRTASHWVLSAKRPETRERRFTTLVTDSAAGRRVKPFLAARTSRS